MVELQPANNEPDVKSERPFEQFLTFRIPALAARMNRQANRLLKETCGLRGPEWRCMIRLGHRGQLNLHGISEIGGLDRGQVTRSIQGLITKGHVMTERDTVDQRIMLAMLTKKGQDTFNKMLPIMKQRHLHLLSSLSSSDQKAFYRIMDHLTVSLENWEAEQKSNEAS